MVKFVLHFHQLFNVICYPIGRLQQLLAILLGMYLSHNNRQHFLKDSHISFTLLHDNSGATINSSTLLIVVHWALLYRYIFHLNCFSILGTRLVTTETILWSLIPGRTLVFITMDGSFVKKRSKILAPQVRK